MKFIKKLSSTSFILLLALYFTFALNLSFWRFFFKNIDNFHLLNICFLLTLAINIFLVYELFFNLIIWKRGWKFLTVVFLPITAATNYFMYAFNIIIDKFMIRNVMETSYREATDLLTTSYFIWLVVFGIIPAVIVCFLQVSFMPWREELKKRGKFTVLSLLFILVSGGVFFEAYKDYGKTNENVHRMLNLFNYTYSTYQYFNKLHHDSRPFTILDKGVHWDDFKGTKDNQMLVVVVIGETARAANYQMDGYKRTTNPYLEKMEDIIYFNEVTSCGTDTSHSVPCLFSAASRDNFIQSSAKYTQNVVDMIQAAGFNVLWRENNESCKGVCDRVPTEYMITLNNPKYCFGLYCYDETLLDGLKEKITNLSGPNNLIVLHLMGSHGPTYYKRYPKKFRKFTPTCDTADVKECTQEELINTYDNTILYTDYVLSELINTLRQFPQKEIALIYVSDHGESLGENGMYFHGFPYSQAPKEQIEVPMILWMNDSLIKYNYLNSKCVKDIAQTNAFSHDNFFHTILGLTKVDSKFYDKKLDIFTPCRLKPLPGALD